MVIMIRELQLIYILIVIFLLFIVFYLHLKLKGITKSIEDLEKLAKVEGQKDSYQDINAIKKQRTLNEIAKLLHTRREEIPDKITNLLAEIEAYRKENRKLKDEVVKMKASELKNTVKERCYGHNLICSLLEELNHEELIRICRFLIQEKDNVILLMNKGEKATFVIGASEDLVNAGFNSAKIAEKFMESLNGKGGGHAHLASGIVEPIRCTNELLKEGREVIADELKKCGRK